MYSTVPGTDECVANLNPGIHEAKMSLIISRSITLKWMIINAALLLQSVN
jgi:hypothetical protein